MRSIRAEAKWLDIVYYQKGPCICGNVQSIIDSDCGSHGGPVFVAMFSPLLTVIVAAMATIILHEKVYAGL
ncbi:hypothetical protein SUGI_0718740 [Cryptomeria japonica]|nr:hypothetical protein SUGI_0718740 [Cryptomeria japonica]